MGRGPGPPPGSVTGVNVKIWLGNNFFGIILFTFNDAKVSKHKRCIHVDFHNPSVSITLMSPYV